MATLLGQLGYGRQDELFHRFADLVLVLFPILFHMVEDFVQGDVLLIEGFALHQKLLIEFDELVFGAELLGWIQENYQEEARLGSVEIMRPRRLVEPADP